MPQGALYGIVGPVQVRCEHVSPGRAQIPQLQLQQTWPTLQVLGPHISLIGSAACAQFLLEHASPRATQMLQLALQHS